MTTALLERLERELRPTAKHRRPWWPIARAGRAWRNMTQARCMFGPKPHKPVLTAGGHAPLHDHGVRLGVFATFQQWRCGNCRLPLGPPIPLHWD